LKEVRYYEHFPPCFHTYIYSNKSHTHTNTTAKVSHPDVRKETDEDAIAFQVLKEAYDVLSDDSKRARYDSKLKAAYSTGQAPKSLSERDRESRSIRESAQSMRKEKAEANAAMPMWYVGQTAEKPTNHQVYYYKQTVAAERAFDISHSRSMRSHKIVPMSRGRSLLWVASPLFVVGVWVYNYANWGSGKEKDPYAKFRKKRERN